jgi:hypothetical protein
VIDDDATHDGCARWVRTTRKKAMESGRGSFHLDGKAYVYDPSKACTCNDYGPYVYAGSHINPNTDDPHGGHVLVCGIPDYCHPDVRGSANPEADGKPVNFVRLSVGEDPATYHGMYPGQATVVLDRAQVKRLRKTLTEWLKDHPAGDL